MKYNTTVIHVFTLVLGFFIVRLHAQQDNTTYSLVKEYPQLAGKLLYERLGTWPTPVKHLKKIGGNYRRYKVVS